MQCKYLFQTLLSISLNQYPEIGLLLDHMIFYFNVFRTAIVFSIALAPFSVPTNSAQECHLLHILTMACYFMFFCFLNSSYPDGCEVVSHGFDLHFPNDDWIWASFQILVSHLNLFRKLPIWILFPILNRVLWVFGHRNSFYHTLNISPLLDTWFAKFFSHAVSCLSTVWIVCCCRPLWLL